MTEQVVRKIATWIPVTDETLADARYLGGWITATFEYELLDPKPALTSRERITGIRRFTASNGVTLRVRVGWRADLFEVMRRFAVDAWPEDAEDDEDDD